MNQIVNIGVDIIEINRIKESINKFGSNFLEKIFTDNEIKYCKSKKRCEESFAVRFCAKESIMKIFKTGWAKGINWRDIEILNDKNGQPKIKLYNKALEFKKKLKIKKFLVSLSHSNVSAIAFVLAIK